MSLVNPWDEVALKYDEVRPSYPDQLIQDIIDITQLSPDDSLLEIGAGSGKATVQLAEKGFRIHCIEPGQNLADILIRKCSRYPNVTVDIAWFEEWTPHRNGSFDLIFCAQAFNWIDPEIRYKKCHELLKHGGYLALFWYGHEAEAWEKDIASSGLFADIRILEYRTECSSSVEQCIKQMESVSTFVTLDEETKAKKRDEIRDRYAREQDVTVRSTLVYTLYLAKNT